MLGLICFFIEEQMQFSDVEGRFSQQHVKVSRYFLNNLSSKVQTPDDETNPDKKIPDQELGAAVAACRRPRLLSAQQHSGLAKVRNVSYDEAMHKHLRRLDRIWLDSPIYFITMCTKDRRAMLARDEVTKILIEEWRAAHERHSWAVGRYVIMPDHVHFFCRPELDAPRLSEFIGAWKSWMSRKIHALGWAAVSDRGYSPVATRVL